MCIRDNLFMRLFFGIRPERKEQENKIFTRVDLDHFVNDLVETEEEKEEEYNSLRIFKNALDFSSVKARECMVPRTEIVAMEVNESIEKLKQKFIQTRLSKILVYSE